MVDQRILDDYLEQRRDLSLARMTAAFAKFALDKTTPIEERLVINSLLLSADENSPERTEAEILLLNKLMSAALRVLNQDPIFDDIQGAIISTVVHPDCGIFYLIVRGSQVDEQRAKEMMLQQHQLEAKKNHVEASLEMTKTRQYLERMLNEDCTNPDSQQD